jgi:hypothetical protein
MFVDGELRQLDVVIATRRRDGGITGRPVTMLATRNERLIAQAFERAESPPRTDVIPLHRESGGSDHGTA